MRTAKWCRWNYLSFAKQGTPDERARGLRRGRDQTGLPQPSLGNLKSSRNSEKQSERAVDAQHDRAFGVAGDAANLLSRNGRDLVDCDLRPVAEAILLGRLKGQPKQIGILPEQARD